MYELVIYTSEEGVCDFDPSATFHELVSERGDDNIGQTFLVRD